MNRSFCITACIAGDCDLNRQDPGGGALTMNMRIGISTLALVFIAGALPGCAGKDEIAPVKVEQQAFEDLRNEIREVIDDPDREAEAIELVNSLMTDLYSLRSRVAERKQRMRELNANYDTSRAEFDAFLVQANQEIQENRRRVGASHQAFLAIVTREELSAIGKVHSKTMDAAIRSIQAI